MKIKKINIILGLMFFLPLNALANVSNTGAIKNEEFSNKTSAELDMNHRFSLSKNSFDLKNDLFEIKIDKEVSFNKRYDTVEFLEKNFAIGKTEVELDKIKYNGIFGEVILFLCCLFAFSHFFPSAYGRKILYAKKKKTTCGLWKNGAE